jgi:hypothetical protein
MTKPKLKAKRRETDVYAVLDIYTNSVVLLAQQHPRPPGRMSWTKFVLTELKAALERSLAADDRKGKRA